jgi:hypothetical protein
MRCATVAPRIEWPTFASTPPGSSALPRLLRQAGTAAAVVILLIELPAGNPFSRASESVATLRKTAGLDLRARRAAGRGPAFDRRFFELVLAAREALPPGTKGIILDAPAIPEWGGRFLAIYELAPVPVVAGPARPQAGWVTLVYGRAWPPGWKLLRSLPGGALLAPS